MIMEASDATGTYPASAYEAGNNMTQNKSDLLTKLVPIAFVATAALWLVVILITDVPAWTLVVYIAVAIPVIQRLSRSAKKDQPN